MRYIPRRKRCSSHEDVYRRESGNGTIHAAAAAFHGHQKLSHNTSIKRIRTRMSQQLHSGQCLNQKDTDEHGRIVSSLVNTALKINRYNNMYSM